MPTGLRLVAALAACGLSSCFGGDAQCELGANKLCKLKVGIVGGGTSFLAGFHSAVVGVGDTRRLVAGAMNSKPEKALESAKKFGITGYSSWKDMLDAWRKGDQELDYVMILSRTRDHYEPMKAFLEAGLAVLCEKPMTKTVAEAEEIEQLVESKKAPFISSPTVTGHPMLMLARELVANGVIGEVRKVEAYFNQDWAAENSGYSWRFDPELSGPAGVAADVGLNAYTLATWVSGRSVKRVSARFSTYTDKRELDESCSILCELDNGGTAVVLASAIAIGYKNEHGLRIFGSKGSLEWSALATQVVIVRYPKNNIQVYTLEGNRTQFPKILGTYPHDTPLLNLHMSLERMVRQKRGEESPTPFKHPGARDAAQAVRFLAAAVESSKQGSAWVDVKAKAEPKKSSSWF